MKKTYMKPVSKVVRIKMASIIAASLPSQTLNNEDAVSSAMGRDFDFDFDDDEE